MITYFYRSVREDKITQLERFRTGAWVHVEAPTPAELELLTEKFSLEEDLLTDALDPDEIPRIEDEEGNIYVYMRHASRREQQVTTSPVLLVVTPRCVISISRLALPDLDRLERVPDLFTTQRPKLLLHLMRFLIGTYERNVTTLTRQIRSVRTRLNVTTVNNHDFIAFVVIEDALNYFLSELLPTNMLLNGLLAGRYKLTFFEEDKDLIEDLIQTTNQLNETSRSSLKTIVNIREAYSNIMTNNLNRQIKLLTSLTVVLTLPTIVFSLYGMNIPIPDQNSPHAFGYVAGGTLVACVVALYILYRKRWL
jgi:magnesium transporter